MIAKVQNWTPSLNGGISLFPGTRVPVQNLSAYLAGGFSIQEFLDDFPSVSPQQVNVVLSGDEAGQAQGRFFESRNYECFSGAA